MGQNKMNIRSFHRLASSLVAGVSNASAPIGSTVHINVEARIDQRGSSSRDQKFGGCPN